MNKTTAGLVAFAAVLLFGGIVLAVVVVAGRETKTEAGANIAGRPGPAPAPAPVASDPWPECATVRGWFRDNVGDPASIEVIRWEDRKATTYSPDLGQGPDRKPLLGKPQAAAVIRVRYRGANQYGGKQVEVREFCIADNRIIWTN